MPGAEAEIARVLREEGVDVGALLLAWARVGPTVALVPALGLRGFPAPARAVFALALAACVFPAMGGVSIPAVRAAPLAAVALEALRGLPIAVAAAVPLWAATMTGGVIDTLRGSTVERTSPTTEARASTMGVPLSLLAASIFFASGGPARVAGALAVATEPTAELWLRVARDVTGGIGVAVSLGGPLLVAAVVFEVGAVLVARAAAPLRGTAWIAPVRAMVQLALAAVLFEAIAAALADGVARAPLP